MTPRVVVLDGDARFCRLIEHHVASVWGDAKLRHVTTLDGALEQAGNGAMILDHASLTSLAAARGKTPFQWLAACTAEDDEFAPIIVAEPSDELLAVRYMKAGAADYIPKRLLKHDLFIAAVREQAVKLYLSSMNDDEPGGDPAAPQPEPTRPKHLAIPGYDIVRSIGSGGMARIYLARSHARGCNVVLKVLDFDDTNGRDCERVQRFERENRLLKSVRSPHVAEIYEYCAADRLCYIAMEYFPHGDLLKRMETPVSAEQAVDYVRQIARALGQIHPLGIIHRDLKPANVMLRDSGTVALIDFGMAKRVDSEEMMTATGSVFGTPHYLSPEQADGDDADARSDLYALGIVFFELLSQRKPFAGRTAVDVCLAHLTEPVPVLPVPVRAFQGVVERLLAKDPAHRFQSAGELLRVLGTRSDDRLET